MNDIEEACHMSGFVDPHSEVRSGVLQLCRGCGREQCDADKDKGNSFHRAIPGQIVGRSSARCGGSMVCWDPSLRHEQKCAQCYESTW